MRLAILSLTLIFAGCGILPDGPGRPAIEILIPASHGWDPTAHDMEKFYDFFDDLEERVEGSDGVIESASYEMRGKTAVVTLYGKSPDQMATIAVPYLRQAHLPEGAKVTKHQGAHGTIVEPVALR